MSERCDLLPQLDRLPHQEIVQFLRALGLQLLKDVLAWRKPKIDHYIGYEQIELFKSMEFAPIPPIGPYSRVVEDVIRRRITLITWEQKAAAELNHILGLTGKYLVPDDFWSVLGKRAWLDLEFRGQIAFLMESYLRQRTLFTLNKMNDQPIISLDPSTLWFLIALTGPASKGQPRRLFGGVFQRSAARNKIIHHLQSIGEQICFKGNWAGLWDQWILIEAANAWSVSGIPSSLVKSIRNFPLACPDQGQETGANTAPAPKESQVDISKPQWYWETPIWFKPWWESRFSHVQGVFHYEK